MFAHMEFLSCPWQNVHVPFTLVHVPHTSVCALLFELRVRNAAALSVKSTVAKSVHSQHSQESRAIRVKQINLQHVTSAHSL